MASDTEARVPALAVYHEWLGEEQTPQQHTLDNITTSIKAQQGDLDNVIMTIHIHPDKGAWVIATAPLNNLVEIPFKGQIA